ncbi:MAG TPA: ABC transporter permease subunit [Gaiellales bacterium]|jgi:ABC-2 type transport system permease protein|nr:ABC transporter permease subunit [Gaiellales bacterium]
MGARRGWKAKVIPIALVLIAFAPAFVVLGLRALFTGVVSDLSSALPYSNYQQTISIVILVFAVVVTPELLCPDRRDRTLTLYFSTAVSRGEYVLGKLLAAILPLLLLTLVPMVFLYAGNVVFAVHSVGYIQHHSRDIVRIVIGGLVPAVFYAFVGLAVASLTSRRAFAIGGYLALMTVPTIVGGVLAANLQSGHYLRLMAIVAAPIKVTQALYPGYTDRGNLGPAAWTITYLAVIAVSAAILAWRYRGDEG